jgi:hypothetical protein
MIEHFEGLEDPRVDRAKRHELLDIIVITICGVICGADNWVEIEESGNAKREWLSRFLGLPNGIPSHDTPAFAGAGSSGECSAVWTQSNSGPAS